MSNLTHLAPLIDFDVVVYRAGFSADSQVKKEWLEQIPEDCPFEKEELEADLANLDYEYIAIGNVKSVIEDVTSQFQGEFKGYLSGHGNFREHVATIKPYKGNRDASHKPKYYKQIKKYMMNEWNAEVVEGQEADDAMAQAQWAAKDQSTVICSIDKDLLQIPGHHYNFAKKEYLYQPLDKANLFLFWQMLEGDVSDNIPGIKGVGKVTISKWWEELDYDLDKIRERVQAQYLKHYGEDWRQAYEEVGSLLWMRRVKDKECPFLY